MEFFQTVGSLIGKFWLQILRGVGTTLYVSLIGTVIGLAIGLLIGMVRTMPTAKNKFLSVCQKILNWIMSAYVEVFRGTPMLVQAMVIYWGIALLNGGKTLNTAVAAILIVSVNTGAYITEIVRGGFSSIDKGQWEGSQAVGMTHWQTMRCVILPQTVRNILPAVSNEFVINIKDTSVLSVLVGFVDLYAVGKIMETSSFKNFESYFIICVVYFLLTFTVTRILRFAEKKLNGKSDYRLYASNAIGSSVGTGGVK